MKEGRLWIPALLLVILAVSVADGAVLGAEAALTCDYRTLSRSDGQDCRFGDLVEISGTNTVSPVTYLSLRGPGIPEEGTPLTNPMEPGSANVATVREDGTWNFSWDSATLYCQGRYWFSPGTYQIVAAADETHQVVREIDFARSRVVGRLNKTVVVEGEDVELFGWASALYTPQPLYIWIFGPTYASYGNVVTLDQDGYYTFVLPTQRVAHVHAGDYEILVQHPMRNRRQDAAVKSGTVVHIPGDDAMPEGYDIDLAGRNPDDAVRLLTTSLRSEYCERDDPCDDEFISLRFSIVPASSQSLQGGDAMALIVPLTTTTVPEATATTPEGTTTTVATTTVPPTTVAETPSPTTAAATATTHLPPASSPADPGSPVAVASLLAVPLLILAFRWIARRR